MSFPFYLRKKELTYNDCRLLEPEFSQAAQAVFSGAQVTFLPAIPKKAPEQWQQSLTRVVSKNSPLFVDETKEIFLPLPMGNNKPQTLAVLQNVESLPGPELAARHQQLSDKLTQIKQWAIDPLTGLLSTHCFLARASDVLSRSREENEPHLTATLALVEMYPRAKNAEQATLYLSKSGAYLDSLIGHIAMTCYFGSGVFGFFRADASHNNSLKIADMLLRWLKRENISTVHIGLAFTGNQNQPADLEKIQEQAWEALQTAGKRGPYSLCSADSLIKPGEHPLRRPPRPVTLTLRRLRRKKEIFALFIIRLEKPVDDDHFPTRVITLAGPEVEVVPIDTQEAFIFLSGIEPEKAKSWGIDFIKRLKAAGYSSSLGLACYPFHDYKKTEIPVNCRKALHHGGFYGPDSLTIFDAVSLNISGDVYYNEGNLTRAVREYRKGLALDPQNINLLNSLGVALAQMNQYRRAIPLFKQVLTIKPDDFMALYNLGFALLARKETAAALHHFEKALKIDDHNFGLLLQLGKLYCRAKRYDEALDVLYKGSNLVNSDRQNMGHEAIYHYLGEACAGLGSNREAIKHLQRAVSHNPRDAGSLSLLGALYNIEKEGGEISLSLCRQAVGLDGSRWQYWLRLGRVYLDQGDEHQAAESFEHGLRVDRKQSEIWYYLGRAYEKMADKRAIKMYIKAVKLDSGNQEAAEALARLQ